MFHKKAELVLSILSIVYSKEHNIWGLTEGLFSYCLLPLNKLKKKNFLITKHQNLICIKLSDQISQKLLEEYTDKLHFIVQYISSAGSSKSIYFSPNFQIRRSIKASVLFFKIKQTVYYTPKLHKLHFVNSALLDIALDHDAVKLTK